jgi:hypothetical protein
MTQGLNLMPLRGQEEQRVPNSKSSRCWPRGMRCHPLLVQTGLNLTECPTDARSRGPLGNRACLANMKAYVPAILA